MKNKTTNSVSSSISLPKKSALYTVRNFQTLKKDIVFFLSRLKRQTEHAGENIFSSSTNKKQKKLKQMIPLALLIIGVGGIIIMAGRIVAAIGRPGNAEDQRTVVKGPKASTVINKEISIPLTDSKGKEITKIRYTIENAELRDEIIVKGTRATAIKGRTFLILTIKIVNEYDKSIDLKVRDYIRLSVNGNEEELLAADIHNDPVNIQAISTKNTRIGFPINDSDKNLILKIGEIKSEKESMPLNF